MSVGACSRDPMDADVAQAHLAQPVVENGQVVRGEVPDDADVFLVQAEIDALAW